MLPSGFIYPAAVLILVGTVDYIRDIRGSAAQPNLVTWGLWSLAPLIALVVQLRAGVRIEAVLTATVGICSLAIFFAVLRQGTFRFRALDWGCAAMSVAALVLWQLTGNGAIGVGFSIVADAFGAAPTLHKAYTDPRSESPGLFALFAISAFVVLLTITQWTVVNAAFSVYIFVLYVVLFALVRYQIGVRLRRASEAE